MWVSLGLELVGVKLGLRLVRVRLGVRFKVWVRLELGLSLGSG